MIKELRIAGSLAVVLSLAGCNSLNQLTGKEETIDYRSTAPIRDDGLSVPPDLTQIPASQRFQVPQTPGGGTTFSEYSSAQSQRQSASAIAERSQVLPQFQDIRIERDGTTRWLVSNLPAEKLFEETLAFWRSQGLTIKTQNPTTGIIETDWAENRANVPQDFLRRTLGRIIDQAYDSGLRERFRTRFERGQNGTIEIYISHQQMVETTISETRTTWVEGKPDPELDAAMLARLMVFLGSSKEDADKALANAAAGAAATAPVATQNVAGVEGALDIREPFDRAWRRVGLALDRGNFTVEDRDRALGQYFVRYVDVDAATKEEGFLSRIFSSGEPKPNPQYRVQLSDVGSATRVTVLDAQGNPDNSATAGRILEVLKQQLK